VVDITKFSVRLNEKEKEKLKRAGEILQIDEKIYGFPSKVIKESLEFVVDFNKLILQRYRETYSHKFRELIFKAEKEEFEPKVKE